ncbi:hypothetical protein WDU94_015329 [Cyamophila willieti]
MFDKNGHASESKRPLLTTTAVVRQFINRRKKRAPTKDTFTGRYYHRVLEGLSKETIESQDNDGSQTLEDSRLEALEAFVNKFSFKQNDDISPIVRICRNLSSPNPKKIYTWFTREYNHAVNVTVNPNFMQYMESLRNVTQDARKKFKINLMYDENYLKENEKIQRHKQEEAEKAREKRKREKLMKNTVKVMMKKPTPFKTMLDFVNKYDPENMKNNMESVGNDFRVEPDESQLRKRRSLTHSTPCVRDSEGSLFGSINIHANSRESNENHVLDDIGDYHPGLGNGHLHSQAERNLQSTEGPLQQQKHHQLHTSQRPSNSKTKPNLQPSEHSSIEHHYSKPSHHQQHHEHHHTARQQWTSSSSEHHKFHSHKTHTESSALDKTELHKLTTGSATITLEAVHNPTTSCATILTEDKDEAPLFESLENLLNKTKYDPHLSHLSAQFSREEDRAEIREIRALYPQLMAEMNSTTPTRVDRRKARRKEKWAQKEYERAMMNKRMLEMKYGKPTTREDLLREEKAWEEMMWRDGERDYKEGKFTGFDISGDEADGDVDNVSLSEDDYGGGDYEQGEEEEHQGI